MSLLLKIVWEFLHVPGSEYLDPHIEKAGGQALPSHPTSVQTPFSFRQQLSTTRREYCIWNYKYKVCHEKW